MICISFLALAAVKRGGYAALINGHESCTHVMFVSLTAKSGRVRSLQALTSHIFESRHHTLPMVGN